jgi:hypothetical protein
MAKPLVYPKIAPNIRSSVDGLGSYYSKGGEYPTDTIDYIKFTEIDVNYTSGGGLSSIRRTPQEQEARIKELGSCYLYIPQSLGTDYGVNYDQVNMGAIGVEAAASLGAQSNEEIVSALQSAASSSSPEAIFNTISSGINSANTLLGTSGSVQGSQLSAIGQGLAFNPFMEQIFQGVNFRNHSFSFKLIARNKTEAEEIKEIVNFFKRAMMPKLENSSASGITATSESDTSNQNVLRSRTSGSRYLKVPNRFKIDFKRSFKYLNDGQIRVTSDSIQDIPGLYRFKECALTNVQVSYTPDGQYVSTDSAFVPAIQMDLRFVEMSIITRDDFDNGFNY